MELGGKYSKLSPAAPWPGGAVFTAEGPGGKKFFIHEASKAEAGAAPFLSHPNLPVYVETLASGKDGGKKQFTVYEFFEGESIAAIIARGGAFTEFEALKTGCETAGALKYLHGLSPRVTHGGVSAGSVFRARDGRVFLCGRAAGPDARADLEGLCGLLRALAAVPGSRAFSDSYSKMLKSLEWPDIEAGHALAAIESLAARPLFQGETPARAPVRRKFPLYAWPLAAGIFLTAFYAAFTFRFEAWPRLRAGRNIRLATELARDFPCPAAPGRRPGLGENLLVNPGLEAPCGWRAYGGFRRDMIRRGSSHGGGSYFRVRKAEDGIYQDIDISQFSDLIARGGCRVKFSGYLSAGGWGSDGHPYLYGYAMRSENDYTYLSGFSPVASGAWTPASYEWGLPAGAKKLRLFLMSSSYRGSFFSKKARFDDLAVIVNCS